MKSYNFGGTNLPADLNLEEYLLQPRNYLTVFIVIAAVLFCICEITLFYR